jgi:hypothetical protein
MSEQAYNLLLQKLDEFIRKYYLNALIRGLIYFLSLGVAIWIAVSLLEYFGRFDSSVRTFLFYLSIFLFLLLFAKHLLKPILKYFALGKRISHEQAAIIIGQHFKEVEDQLINLLQLKSSFSEYPTDLIEASISQKIEKLKPIPFSLAINLSENKRYLKYLLAPAMALMAIVLFSPEVISESNKRIVAYGEEFEPLAPYRIVLESDSLQAFKNEDFKLKVFLEGEQLPNQLKVQFEGQRYLMNRKSARKYEYTFKALDRSFEFRLFDGEFTSKSYRLTVLPRPSLVSFKVELLYPSYLNKKNESFNNQGDLVVPEGTIAKWYFKTKETEAFSFFVGDSVKSLNQVSEGTFYYKQQLMKSGQYGLKAENELFSQKDTLWYDLEVIPDLRPSIELDVQKDSTNPKSLFFKGFIKDDYGFSRLNFFVKTQSKEQTSSNFKQQKIPINTALPQTEFYHSLNINDFQLAAGESISYYFEVWDNDGINGSKSSKTPTYTFKAPSEEQLKQKEKKSNQEIKEKIKENISLSKEIKRDLEKLNEKLLNKKNIGFQEKKQFEELIKKQKQLRENMDELSKQNQKKNQLQNSFDPMDEELVKKQEQLQELFEKVMSDEMKAMMEEMEKMMEKLDPKKMQEELEKIELNNAELEKELDRNLELFKQLELEKQLKDAREKLEEIKEKQAELKEETKNEESDSKELANKQEKLNKEFEELQKELDDVEKKNQELENPFEMEKTDSLEEQIKEDMKESAQELQNSQKQESSEEQEQAEEGMDELAEKLSNMQMNMQAQGQEENLEDMRALLENLITLSFDQEDIMEQLKKIDETDPKYRALAQNQNKLQDDSKVIEDSLFALSKRVLQLAPIVNREMGLVKRNMEKAVELLGERKTAVATSRQQLAMTSINNLALLIDEAVQQMQQQMQSMMQSKSQCKKPGGKPGGKPSLGGLKKMQQQLRKQMEALKKSMQSGKMPNGKKGEGSSGKGSGKGMSKELAQMAAKQAAIRKAIEELQNEAKGTEAGGQLEKIGEMMEENETDLVNKKITNETILRQQEILTRLLQSEKAQREREQDPKRESNEFTDEFSRNPKNFFEYNKAKQKELELLKTMPPSFSPFYKSKVSDYFNRK